MSLGANSLPGRCAGLHPPSQSSSAGGACTSAGRGQSSADVGSRSRSSLRRRAALSPCCVVFVSFLLHSSLPAAARAAARDYPGGLLSTSRAPASLGRTVRRRQSARAPLGFRPRSPPRPGPAVGASAPPESLLALAARPPGAERRSQRPEKKRASETEGWPGQVVAPRRWSPSSGSVWPTRSTARTSRSAAMSPRPREMLLKRRRL